MRFRIAIGTTQIFRLFFFFFFFFSLFQRPPVHCIFGSIHHTPFFVGSILHTPFFLIALKTALGAQLTQTSWLRKYLAICLTLEPLTYSGDSPVSRSI